MAGRNWRGFGSSTARPEPGPPTDPRPAWTGQWASTPDSSRFHEGSALDVVPAQFSLAFDPGVWSWTRRARREIDHILFARVGQTVGLVGRTVCQKLTMRRAVKEIEGTGNLSRATHHALGQCAVPEVLFVETSRGTTGEDVSPEPFRRLPAGTKQPAPVAAVYFDVGQRTGAVRMRCRRAWSLSKWVWPDWWLFWETSMKS